MRNTIRTIMGGVIAVLIATAIFRLLPKTPNCIVAFIATLVAISELSISLLLLTRRESRLPQVYSFPLLAYTYAGINLSFSILVIALELSGIWTMPCSWFYTGHAVLLAIFGILVLGLQSGKEHIESIDDKAEITTKGMKQLRVEIDSLLQTAKDSNTRKLIQSVQEALRYSDPVSSAATGTWVNQIREKLQVYKQSVSSSNEQAVSSLTVELLRLINERNAVVRSSK